MKKEEFNTIYKYIGNNSIAYILILKGKNVVESDDRCKIVDYLKSSNNISFLKVNVSFSQEGNFSIQNIAPKSRRSNAIMFNHKSFLDIASHLGINIDKAIRNKAVYVKYYDGIAAQEKRWERKKKEDFVVKESVRNSKIGKKLRDWMTNTRNALEIKKTNYERRVYNRLKRTFGNKVSTQHPFVIDGKVYFADICIKCKKVIIEVDGGYHEEKSQSEKDKERDNAFSSIGYKTIRITNEQVRNGRNLNSIVREILSMNVE